VIEQSVRVRGSSQLTGKVRYDSKWWVRREADVFVLTRNREAVEQLGFAR
jgi:hypothetical protein